jgi:predicted TIM-barrel fold metal-dependent hydrolase
MVDHPATVEAKRGGAAPRSDAATLPLSRYRPRSQLRRGTTEVARPRWPVIDAHNHLGRWLSPDGGWTAPEPARLLDLLDAAGVEAVVNLDGRAPADLAANLDRYGPAMQGRVVTFCQLDWRECAEPGWPERLAAQLAHCAGAGAAGLKVWKDVGLHVRDEHRQLVLPDDPRLEPIWGTAAEQDLPVVIHTADPAAFFEPVDERNERLEELSAHPDWSFADPTYPRWSTLLDALERAIATHPAVTFIVAHAHCAEDLDRVERLLEAHPNAYIDIAARIAELGRRPRRARELFLRFPDRILFGTDAFPPSPVHYRIHYRFLETADESFEYSPEDPPPQGRWTISGLDLPRQVLRDVYAENARRIVPALRG